MNLEQWEGTRAQGAWWPTNKEHPKSYRKHIEKMNSINLQKPLQTQCKQLIRTVLTGNIKYIGPACLHSGSNHPWSSWFCRFAWEQSFPSQGWKDSQVSTEAAGSTNCHLPAELPQYPNPQIPRDILPASFPFSAHCSKWKKTTSRKLSPARNYARVRALLKKGHARTHKSWQDRL